jgi:hypothetical protein
VLPSIWSGTADDELACRVGTARESLYFGKSSVPAPLPTLRRCACVSGLEPFVIDFDRQKITGWILVVVSTAFILYFLKVRLFGIGPSLERKEWFQFIISIVVLMIGTMNVRLAARREERRRGRSK